MNENGRALVEAMHREAVERLRAQALPPAEAPTIHYTELPEASPDSPLYQAWNTYRREVGRLLAERQEGKFVLVKDDAVIGLYDTWDAAREEGLWRYLLNPFLVHQAHRREPILRLRGYNLPAHEEFRRFRVSEQGLPSGR
jgi:hypothetical protein